jgi:shikimate kinase
MMGSGKTTVGRRLAQRLERPFVDADDELVRRSGRTVRQWFEQAGEPAFRDAEADLLADLLSAPGPAVIACGGGVVGRPDNRALLRQRATVVWLRAGVPFLVSRLRTRDHRPLLDDDPAVTIERLVAERSALYDEVSDVVIDVEPFHSQHEKPKREMATRIASMVREVEGVEEGEG